MYNLIIKDIAIQKKTFLYALIIAILSSVNFMNPGPNGFILYVFSPILLNYTFINFALSYDDKNKSEITLNSLPINRNDLVLAKYASIFVFAAIGIFYSIIIGFIGNIAGFSMFTTSSTLNDVVTVLICTCIYNSILFPIYFKLGYAKSQIFTFIMITLIMIAFSNSNNIVIQKFTQFIHDSSSLKIYSTVILTSIISILISLLASIYIYNKREF